MMRDFGLWFHSTVLNTAGGLSCGGSIIFSIITIYTDWPISAKILFGSIALLSFTFACFWSWRKLKQQITSDLQKQSRRNAIGDIMLAGTDIIQKNALDSPGIPTQYSYTDPRPEDVTAINSWQKLADNFILMNYNWFLGRYRNDGSQFTPGSIQGKSPEWLKLWEKMVFRIDRLRELQAELEVHVLKSVGFG